MIFKCPYCFTEYETWDYFPETIFQCGICHQKFTLAHPRGWGITPPVEKAHIHRYQESTPSSSGLLTPTNILAGIGLYSLFK